MEVLRAEPGAGAVRLDRCQTRIVSGARRERWGEDKHGIGCIIAVEGGAMAGLLERFVGGAGFGLRDVPELLEGHGNLRAGCYYGGEKEGEVCSTFGNLPTAYSKAGSRSGSGGPHDRSSAFSGSVNHDFTSTSSRSTTQNKIGFPFSHFEFAGVGRT